ncbi:hypothetical protein [Amycolatopsis magusensis]|uniref:hypothetical protein n=1 Tax=Amycolatopsis magusensis TaxID=882444 RepID=UPI0037B09D32
MTIVRTWTGREAKVLRAAMRSGVRDFAARLDEVRPSTCDVARWSSGDVESWRVDTELGRYARSS